MAVELTSPILRVSFLPPSLPGIWERCTQWGKGILGRNPGRNQDGGPGFLAGSETTEMGVRLEHLNMETRRMRLERRQRWERIGKGQHICWAKRVMKDAMIKCSSLAFSGHCAEGNEDIQRTDLVEGRVSRCSGVNRTLLRWLRRACNRTKKGNINCL